MVYLRLQIKERKLLLVFSYLQLFELGCIIKVKGSFSYSQGH